jgi:hypothetical protein
VVTDVRTNFDGNWLGYGEATITYTLHNNGNVLYGVEPTVGIAGPLGLLGSTADGELISELLPGAEVTQSVVLPGVWAQMLNTVTVDGTAVPTRYGGGEPGIGTVRVTATVFLWSTLVFVALLAIAALAFWLIRRAHRVRAWNRYWLGNHADDDADESREADEDPERESDADRVGAGV